MKKINFYGMKLLNPFILCDALNLVNFKNHELISKNFFGSVLSISKIFYPVYFTFPNRFPEKTEAVPVKETASVALRIDLSI